MDPLTSLGFLPGERELRTRGGQLVDFLSAVDPVQGIMRGMSASGRAFDDDLPPEVRRQAAIEAALETAVPVGMMGLGSLLKQPAKAALLDMLTLTGAPGSMAREPGTVPRVDRVAPVDPSRRKFLGGLASLPVAAAIAPDILAKGSKVAARVSTNALDSAAANMGALKKAILDLEILREDAIFTDIPSTSSSGRAGLLPSEVTKVQQNLDQYNQAINDVELNIKANEHELANHMSEMFDVIVEDPKLLKGASDDTLETLAQEFYDNSVQRLSGAQVRAMSPGSRMPFEELAKEIRRRGLDKKKTESGVNQYSSSKTFAADILDPKEDPWSTISAADKTVPRR
jgi:hypothetical protein